jgi:hypothetical protein
MNGIRTAILRTLIYFEIFGHPLSFDELYSLLSVPAKRENFDRELDQLASEGLIRVESGYVFIADGQASITERLKKLRRAARYGRIARAVSRLISWHPYVRGVFISGSLSKSALSKKDDIDFFVVTEPGRLWVCRTLLMLFKKIFMLNSKKYFCINYYIDTRSLEIPERNLFTATEVAFLIPVQNAELYTDFIGSNGWIREYFPNRSFSADGCPTRKPPLLKRWVESMLNGKTGERLDNHFMKVYRMRSIKRFEKMDRAMFELNFRSEKNVSKHHPDGYQEKILEQHARAIAAFDQEHGTDLAIST